MKSTIELLTPALTLILVSVTMALAQQTGRERNVARTRPEGPCDIYAAAGTPCVAAHSTTRALYASYDGPLYQIKRQPDPRDPRYRRHDEWVR